MQPSHLAVDELRTARNVGQGPALLHQAQEDFPPAVQLVHDLEEKSPLAGGHWHLLLPLHQFLCLLGTVTLYVPEGEMENKAAAEVAEIVEVAKVAEVSVTFTCTPNTSCPRATPCEG